MENNHQLKHYTFGDFLSWIGTNISIIKFFQIQQNYFII